MHHVSEVKPFPKDICLSGPAEALHNWSSLLISFSLNYSSYNVISLKGLENLTAMVFITLLLAHRIPCEHNAWAADNLASLDMPFLSIIACYNKPNKHENHTSTFVY